MKISELSPTQQAEVKLAIKWGFKPIPDVRRGRGWYKFSRGQRMVWSVPPHWISADFIDGYYQNQMKHPQLADGLRRPIGGSDGTDKT
jgi:hypothetical protein